MTEFLKRRFSSPKIADSNKKHPQLSQPKKSVSFSSNLVTMVHQIPQCDTDSDPKSIAPCCWKEYSEILDLVMQKVPLHEIDQRGLCTRGFENSLPEPMKASKKRRVYAQNAVFFEQKLQASVGLWNPKQIARVYARYAKKSAKEALERAKLDEEQVLDSSESKGSERSIIGKILHLPQRHRFYKPKTLSNGATGLPIGREFTTRN